MRVAKEILEIGCGSKRQFKNSISMDIRRTDVVDIVADGRMLPFQDESFDTVYSSHTLEHFSHREVRCILREWTRVLKVGGELELRCPDLKARSLIFTLSPSWRNVEDIYGSQDFPENYHKCGFSYGMLKELLEDFGIIKTRRIRDRFRRIPLIPCDLHVAGIKSNSRKTIRSSDRK